MTALLDAGFETAPALKDARSNIGGDKYYDQVAFRTEPGFLEYTNTPTGDGRKRTRRATTCASTTSTGAHTSSPTTSRCGSSCE
jgi:hypothetical protein